PANHRRAYRGNLDHLFGCVARSTDTMGSSRHHRRRAYRNLKDIVVKALLCKQFGGPASLQLEDIEPLVHKAGQIGVAVKAAGVTIPDTHIIQGKYQLNPELPFSPGSEVAGVVARVGPDVTEFSVGDRVVAPIGYGGFAEEAIAE